jgi:hypothetical protein
VIDERVEKVGNSEEGRAVAYTIALRTRRRVVLDVDNLETLVRDALFTTRATAVCPFHPEVIIRVGDSAAETHAYYRARNVIKSDGTSWEHEDLIEEIARQLTNAADGACPRCAHMADSYT